MKHYTTIEQSKKLLELGLSRDTADMVYQYNFLSKSNDTTPRAVNGNLHDTTLRNIPCWSLGALLELMPKDCGIDKENNKYVASYVASHEVLEWDGNTPFEGAFNMICWLIEQGYIKTEKI